MLDRDQLLAISREMLLAQDEVRQIAPFSTRVAGFDLPSAYAIANLIHRDRMRRGAVPVGRKIGFTNPDMWSLYGVREPIWAHVYDTTVVHVDGEAPTLRLDQFTEPKIEPEIVLHFDRAIPPGSGPAEILSCIDWIAHAFEIVQSHFPGWKFGAPDTVADWGLHGMLLVGERLPTARLGANAAAQLRDFRLSLQRNGAGCAVGAGSNVLGSPLLAIAHLVSVLHNQPDGEPLRNGELVTTGTITAAQSVRAGERWSTALEGIALPGLSVEFC